MNDHLTPLERLFVDEYMIDLNGTRAYQRMGGASKHPSAAGSEMLAKPSVRAEVDRRTAERAVECKAEANKILDLFVKIATADPNELSQYRHRCCRYCYGVDFKYQWRDAEEFGRAIQAALDEHEGNMSRALKVEGAELPKLILPSDEGGYDFNPRLEPVDACPKCDGEGKTELYIADTRRLSAAGRRLYAGVKRTKDGIEVKMRDQDAAAVVVARYLGMLNDKLTVTQNGVTTDDAEAVKKLSNEELASLIAIRRKMAGEQ